jgi:hypothetical protein
MTKKKTESKPDQELSKKTKNKLKLLKHFVPYLRQDYRELKKDELRSKETFKELFPNEDYTPLKLKTIYEYQQLKK